MGTPKAEPFPQAQPFSLSVTTDEEFSAGEWVPLPCGLEVHLAPAGTQEAARLAASMAKKHGANTMQELRNMKIDNAAPYSVALAARAHFKGFRGPGGKPVEINGEVWEDTLQTRERVLRELPQIKREIEVALEVVNKDFQAAIEETGKN